MKLYIKRQKYINGYAQNADILTLAKKPLAHALFANTSRNTLNYILRNFN